MLSDKNEIYYKAIQHRDPKFDGRIYFGVKTTGIYCRPICPAKPNKKNVSFYPTQAAAETAGFRPCKRCRPDLSPLSPQWHGTAAIIGRALEAIKKAEVPLSEVATRMGMTDRHLRRLFSEHVGASPIQIMQSYRLHLAQQLLAQTSMKMIDVAMAAGFGSVRRFNDAFAKTYKKPPADIRKEKQADVNTAKGIQVEIPVVGDFDFQSALYFFRRHLVEGVEFIGADFYERQFEYGTNSTGWFKVTFNEKRGCVQVQIDSDDTAHIRFVIERVKALFDLQHNPAHIEVKSARHQVFACEIQKIRIPGAFSTFETAVCIILGQLVSTERARQLVKSLVATYGRKLKHEQNENLQFLFPTAAALATAPLEQLGLTRQRAQAIRDFSAAVLEKKINLDVPIDLQTVRQQLIQIKGVGPWTVEMMAIRCLSDADAFPAKDLIIQRELQSLKIDAHEFTYWKSYLTLAIWQKSSGYSRADYPTPRQTNTMKARTTKTSSKRGSK